jgi:thiamine biosynthesis lipoprotein
MGSFFSIKILHNQSNNANLLIDLAFTEIARIENLLSEYKDESDIGRINNAAGKYKVKVDKEVYQLLERSCNISRITNGAFDVTIGDAKKLYSFNKSEVILPNDARISESQQSIGYSNIEFHDDFCIFLNNANTRISLAAIGKGYAADQIKVLLQKNGIGSGVVNASGDLTAWGINKKKSTVEYWNPSSRSIGSYPLTNTFI